MGNCDVFNLLLNIVLIVLAMVIIYRDTVAEEKQKTIGRLASSCYNQSREAIERVAVLSAELDERLTKLQATAEKNEKELRQLAKEYSGKIQMEEAAHFAEGKAAEKVERAASLVEEGLMNILAYEGKPQKPSTIGGGRA